MFLRTFGYSLLRSVRQKELLFWSIAFPIILGTLFKISFGDINKTVNQFSQIPVAYVEETDAQKEFKLVLNELENENELVKVVPLTKEEAKKQLKEEKVKGIFVNSKDAIQLTVTEEGVKTSILKSIQDQYEQTMRAVKTIAKENPEKIGTALKNVGTQVGYLKSNAITKKDMDMYMDYFYALIAMNCLYACFSGVVCAVEYKANLSALAARQVVASTNRKVLLLAEVSAKTVAQFVCCIIGVCYLRFALQIDLGSEHARMMLVILFGTFIGIMTGLFVGSIGKLKHSTKEGLAVAITMFECFLSGLMVGGMYQLLEKTAPIVNRINPASLIVRAFYSLNIYDTYTRYNQCIISLFVIAVLLCIASYLVIRRERYASV